jgi:hypothetical protein
MAIFKCPECEALSTSNREATYFWCPCGHPLTGADAVPEMVSEALADETAPAPPAPEEPPAPVQPVLDVPPPGVAKPVQRVSG